MKLVITGAAVLITGVILFVQFSAWVTVFGVITMIAGSISYLWATLSRAERWALCFDMV